MINRWLALSLFLVIVPACFAGEWFTDGGDYAFTRCSGDSSIAPPFRLKWRAPFHGAMFKNGPVVAENKVFLTSRMGAVMALDADSGTLLWRRDFPYAYGRNAATYAQGRLYVFNSYNKRKYPYDGPADYRNYGGLHCLNTSTGATLWRQPVGMFAEDDARSPGYINGVICKVFSRYPDTVTGCKAWDAATGDSLWYREFPAGLKLIASGIAGVGDTFFISIGFGPGEVVTSGKTLKVRASDGHIYWEAERGAGRVAYRDGTVLVGQTGLSAATGDSLWKAPDKVCFTPELLSTQGRQIQRKSGFGGCGIQVVVNGYSYSQVRGYDGGRPLGQWTQQARKLTDMSTPVWSYEFNSSVCPHLVPAYGKMYGVATGDGAVYCFEPEN